MEDKNKKSNTNNLDSQKIILTNNDRDIFLSLIENPPEPNHVLKYLTYIIKILKIGITYALIP